jgi:hypothetical protein
LQEQILILEPWLEGLPCCRDCSGGVEVGGVPEELETGGAVLRVRDLNSALPTGRKRLWLLHRSVAVHQR